MTWTKLDDRFHDHPKIRRAWRRDRTALGLHVLTINYSSAHDLDGLVMPEFVEDQLPDRDERERATKVLLDCDLWTDREDGWLIHDFLDFNPSRKEVLARRKSDARRKRAERADAKSGPAS
jgi:hypothetical protein